MLLSLTSSLPLFIYPLKHTFLHSHIHSYIPTFLYSYIHKSILSPPSITTTSTPMFPFQSIWLPLAILPPMDLFLPYLGSVNFESPSNFFPSALSFPTYLLDHTIRPIPNTPRAGTIPITAFDDPITKAAHFPSGLFGYRSYVAVYSFLHSVCSEHYLSCSHRWWQFQQIADAESHGC
jgi:hypothetical protein